MPDNLRGGMKHDLDKLRYDLLSPIALEGLVKVLTYGAKKYEDRNWEKGIKWSRVFAALCRHLWSLWKGEDIDTESGLPHIDHVQCCAHFLSHYRIRKKDFDDRPTTKERRSKMKCCLCGKEITIEPITGWSYGNNAEPVKAGRCCTECNYTKVIPARLLTKEVKEK